MWDPPPIIHKKFIIFYFSGSCYAKSAGFDHVFDTSEIEKMSRTVNNEETDIFITPPKGFSIVKNVPATREFNVLTGQSVLFIKL